MRRQLVDASVWIRRERRRQLLVGMALGSALTFFLALLVVGAALGV